MTTCPDCGGTGLIPPFMDPCPCAPTTAPSDQYWNDEAMAKADAEAEAAALAAAAAVVDEIDAEAIASVITCERCGKTTTDPDKWDPEADTGRVFCDACWPLRDEKVGEWSELVYAPDAGAWTDELVCDDAVVTNIDIVPEPTWTPKGEKLATEPQKALLARLTAERDSEHPVVAHALSASSGTLTAKAASKLIDSLMAVPATKKLPRENKYDGTCCDCGGAVPAKTGTIHKDEVSGRWKTRHKPGACLDAAGQAALEADKVTEPGLYKLTTDSGPSIYRVRKSRSSTRLYAEKIIVHEHNGEKHVDFAYNAKAMAWLRKSDKLTWAEAREFGAAYGACVACGRTLSDARSLVQGYGATCAKHYHWPTVTTKQAESIIAGVLTWDDVISDLGVLTS